MNASLRGRAHALLVASVGCLVLFAAAGCKVEEPLPGTGKCPLTGEKGKPSISPVQAGALTVETNLPAPDWWNGDTPDTIVDGFEYCLAANIANRLGLDKIRVVHVAFEALVAGHTRNYDLALSQLSITEPRKKVVEFSVPYYASNVAALVKRGVKVDSSNVRDLRIGVQGGTTGAAFVQTKIKPKTPALVFSDSAEMFTSLLAGQIDVVITDTAILMAQAKASHGRFYVAGQYETGEFYGAMFPKGSKNVAAINAAIQALDKDGTIAMLSDKYLVPGLGADPNKLPNLGL